MNTFPEKYWHCSVKIDAGPKNQQSSVVNDLSFGQAEMQIIRPWREGKPFTVSGLVVSDKSKVISIRLVQTQYSKDQYSQEHYARMEAAGIVDMATDARHLPFSKGTDFTHKLLFSELSTPPPDADVALLLRLCSRLQYAAKIVGTRSRKGKISYSITDEYDAQDLLHAIIRCYLKYSVQEEPLGKVAATTSSRADIAIEELGTIIELKFVHGPSDQARILDEYAKDLVLYAKWPHLRTFIYLARIFHK